MLKISKELSLPLDVAGEAMALLATRGAGKSYASAVLVEELFTAGVQTVVLDPTGVYWGLRGSGEKNGLPVYVFGGAHGDLPLESTAGGLFADLAVDEDQSFVLDLSAFDTKGEQTRFVRAFAERLYRRKAQNRQTLTLVVDEADEFAPQRPLGKDEPFMLGAMEAIVRRGRSRGLGVILLTQRSAALNKNVLDLAETLIVMRTLGPRDRKAIEGWISVHELADELGVLESLPSLPTGTGWVWSPVRDILKKVNIRRIRTFDSYQTPKPGEVRPEPKEIAPIDLGELGEKMAATVEKAKASDPRELRKRIAELERELAKRPTETVIEERIVEERVEVPVLAPGNTLETVLLPVLERTPQLIEQATAELRTLLERVSNGIPPKPKPAVMRGSREPAARTRGEDTGARIVPSLPSTGDEKLGKGEMRVLGVLAEFPEGRTQNEVAFLAGYSANASTIGVILSKLRKMGLVELGQPVRPTAEGLETVGGPVDRPTGQELLDHWLRHPRMGTGERTVFLALIDAYPNALTHEELCEITGYSPSASTMGVILSKLRKLGLVERGQRRIAPELMDAIGT